MGHLAARGFVAASDLDASFFPRSARGTCVGDFYTYRFVSITQSTPRQRSLLSTLSPLPPLFGSICWTSDPNDRFRNIQTRREFKPSIQTHPATQPKPSSSLLHVHTPTIPHSSHKTHDYHLHKHRPTREPAISSFRTGRIL